MRIREVLRKLLLPAMLGVVALTSLGLLGDIGDVLATLRDFQWGYLPVIMIFGFGNDIIKFLRWDYYLKCLGIRLSRKDSLRVFIAGLAFSATPGKIGFIHNVENHVLWAWSEYNGFAIKKTHRYNLS